MSCLLVRGGRLFDPASDLDAVGDLLICGGRIAGVGSPDDPGDAEVMEAAGLMVVPGLMDIHVHLREPGQEHKETVATGTRAAAAGGFAAVACEPNTVPPRDTAQRIGEVLALAQRDARVRVLPKGAITLGQQGEELTDLEALQAAGAVAASDDGFAVADGEVMRGAMEAAKQARLSLTVHVDGPDMVERDIGLAAECGWMVHFSHVSLAEEAELIARAQRRGLPVSGEATPHHLWLSADDSPIDDPNFKMNPPLRSAGDVAALRQALAQGVISVIASDHAPHSAEEKSGGFDSAPPGVIGLETTLGVVWTALVRSGRLDAGRAVRAMTSAPAVVLNIAPPFLREGARGDVTLFDPDAKWEVDPERFESKSRNCPFAGRTLWGRAVATIVAGRAVMREGAITEEGAAE